MVEFTCKSNEKILVPALATETNQTRFMHSCANA